MSPLASRSGSRRGSQLTRPGDRRRLVGVLVLAGGREEEDTDRVTMRLADGYVMAVACSYRRVVASGGEFLN